MGDLARPIMVARSTASPTGPAILVAAAASHRPSDSGGAAVWPTCPPILVARSLIASFMAGGLAVRREPARPRAAEQGGGLIGSRATLWMNAVDLVQPLANEELSPTSPTSSWFRHERDPQGMPARSHLVGLSSEEVRAVVRPGDRVDLHP